VESLAERGTEVSEQRRLEYMTVEVEANSFLLERDGPVQVVDIFRMIE
jgi:hypothetical protein